MIKKECTVEVNIIFFAFRYALGRRTFAPTIVIEAVKDNIDKFTDADLAQMRREIQTCQDYGMDMDKITWLNFLRDIDDEIRRRMKASEHDTGNDGEVKSGAI